LPQNDSSIQTLAISGRVEDTYQNTPKRIALTKRDILNLK
jgi:hypothetical protein